MTNIAISFSKYSGLSIRKMGFLIRNNINLETTKEMFSDLFNRYFVEGKDFNLYSIISSVPGRYKYIIFEASLKLEIIYTNSPTPEEYLKDFAQLFSGIIDELEKAVEGKDGSINYSLGVVGELSEIFDSIKKSKLISQDTNIVNKLNKFIKSYNDSLESVGNKKDELIVTEAPRFKELEIAVSKMKVHELEMAIYDLWSFSEKTRVKIVKSAMKKMPNKIIEKAPYLVFSCNKEFRFENIDMELVIYRMMNGYLPGGYVQTYKQTELDCIKEGCTKHEALDVVCDWLRAEVDGYAEYKIDFLKGISLKELQSTGTFSKDSPEYLEYLNQLIETPLYYALLSKSSSISDLFSKGECEVPELAIHYKKRHQSRRTFGGIFYDSDSKMFKHTPKSLPYVKASPSELFSYIDYHFSFHTDLKNYIKTMDSIDALQIDREFYTNKFITLDEYGVNLFNMMVKHSIERRITDNCLNAPEMKLFVIDYPAELLNKLQNNADACVCFLEMFLSLDWDLTIEKNRQKYFDVLHLTNRISTRIDIINNTLHNKEIVSVFVFKESIFRAIKKHMSVEYELVFNLFNYDNLEELKKKLNLENRSRNSYIELIPLRDLSKEEIRDTLIYSYFVNI